MSSALTSGCSLALGFAAAVVVAGCSSSPSASAASASVSPDASAAVDAAGTDDCTGGQAYSANMTAPGSSGVYTFTLVQAAPAPPALYGNNWTLKIADASGASPSASQLIAYPFMPLMGHGSDQVPTITANADGTFNVADVYLFMPGLWTVTISVVEAPDAASTSKTPITLDKIVYAFCVD